MTSLTINGQLHEVDVPDDMPLLWVIRDTLGFTGTKYGCGKGLCGACTMHLNDAPIRACITPVSAAAGGSITTIEGISEDPIGKIVQDAWLEEGVPQCGFCQCGQIMSATALLKGSNSPEDSEIEGFMAANLCRCGTYNRIKTAIHTAAANIKD